HMQGARGIPWRAPKGGTYLRGKRRVYFWRPELDDEPKRLTRYAEAQTNETATADPSSFILLGRRRRLGQNSWIHGAGRDGKSEAYAWLCAEDMTKLNLKQGDDISLSTASGEIRLPVFPREGVMSGTVIVPHGVPEVNVNKLIGSDHSLIEPLSGMHRMTGNRVHISAVKPL
ncbi:MAG TPA: molybdopterin dinucleotide binding domain-containing protein, partial [Phototrophicaceae bacterium]|nr:molybdopterin dinucleotide binding domain-containing protein [Phototrophicaceae bacterium]